MQEIVFDSDNIPSHETLAAAYLAAAAIVAGTPLPAQPTVRRINEDYGFTQEEFYTHGTDDLGLKAHAVGMMSGHGRHGSKTQWQGCGFALTGSSVQNRLQKSFARLKIHSADPGVLKKAHKAFAVALAQYDAAANREGEAISAIQSVISAWQTGPDWPREALIERLRSVLHSSAAHLPAGATVRFLLARLLLQDGVIDDAATLLDELEEQGQSLVFHRGVACGLAADGSLWFVYRPSKTPPPQPWMEVQLARGWVAECRGDREEAVRCYQSILDVPASLSGGIRPDTEAAKQLTRLGITAD